MNHLRMRRQLVAVMGTLAVAGVVVAGWSGGAQAEKPTAPMSKKSNVTIDVKDTDITRVLDAFSQQTGLSVVIGKEVTGTVTVRLFDVQWDQALDSILKPYGFGYERTGDVIIVLPAAKLGELNEAQPLTSRVFKLRYLDAGDVKPLIESQLSPRGRHRY